MKFGQGVLLAVALDLLTRPSGVLGKGTSARKLEEVPFTDTCTSLVGVGIDPADPLGDDQTFLSCLTPDGSIHRFKGVCKDWIYDYCKKDILKSNFSSVDLPEETTYDTDTDQIVLEYFPPKFTPESGKHPGLRRKGIHTVLAVRVTVDGSAPTNTSEEISNSLFGIDGHHPVNLKSQMSDCSTAQLDLRPASSQAVTIKDGVLDVSLSGVAWGGAYGESFLVNNVTSELRTLLGGQLPWEAADFVLYCLPDGAMPGTAYGYVNSWLSVYKDTACTNILVQLREIGHNLGMGPSYVATDGQSHEWGTMRDTWDTSGAMGGDTFDSTKGSICFNSAKAFQTGWFEDETLYFGTESTPESVSIQGITKPADPNQVKVVKLERTSEFDAYITCNWKHGHNVDTEYGANTATIVGQGQDGMAFSRSFLLANLTTGEMYHYPGYFDGACDLNVTVDAIDPAAGVCSVTITACPENMPTPAPTPIPPTVTPTEAPTIAPTTTCIPLEGICESEDDCCVSEESPGACIKESTNEGLNSKIICKASPDAIIDPVAYPGTCNNDGVCGWGENCYSCPDDCNSMLSGDRDDRYCCDGNLGKRPAGAPTYSPTAAPTQNCRIVDFDFSFLERGYYLHDQFLESSGIRFSGLGKGRKYCWTPADAESTIKAETYGHLRVFDTWIPVGGEMCDVSEGDLDLGSPNENCADSDITGEVNGRVPTWRKPGKGVGGAPFLEDGVTPNPYKNCHAQGKALVLQDSNKTCPDECEYGGLMLIQFPYQYGANVSSLTLLNLNRNPHLRVWKEHGGLVFDQKLIGEPYNYGRNSALKVDINLPNVRAIRISLYGTGALGGIEYEWCQDYKENDLTGTPTSQWRRDLQSKSIVSKFSIRPDDPKCLC